MPVLLEAFVTASLARWIFNLPSAWCFTLSFGIASISPGVVVPLILRLIDNGWQKSKLPPLLLTALGIDILVGTAGFGIALAACFGHKHEHNDVQWHNSWIGRGIEELLMGFLMGSFLAILMLLYTKIKLPESITTYLVFGSSALAMLWCKTNGFAGAASCSTFITWGSAANTWTKKDIEKADHK